LHFVSATTLPLPSRTQGFWQDMYACDEVFRQVEDYEMTADYLASSKIGKVMRHVGNKDEIPRQEEFRFQERAGALVVQWSQLLTEGRDDYANFYGCMDMGVGLPIIYDILKARRQCVGNGSSLKEVIVVSASGRATSVTLPYSQTE
jgi:hypothetical protein